MLKVNVNSAAQIRLKVHNDLLLNSGRYVYGNIIRPSSVSRVSEFSAPLCIVKFRWRFLPFSLALAASDARYHPH